MGKSSINVSFSMAMLVITRGYNCCNTPGLPGKLPRLRRALRDQPRGHLHLVQLGGAEHTGDAGDRGRLRHGDGQLLCGSGGRWSCGGDGIWNGDGENFTMIHGISIGIIGIIIGINGCEWIIIRINDD